MIPICEKLDASTKEFCHLIVQTLGAKSDEEALFLAFSLRP